MDADVVEAYWKAIDVIEAQEMLKALQVSDYPYLKKEGRKRLYKSMHNKAYPNENVNAKILTTEQVDKFLGMG